MTRRAGAASARSRRRDRKETGDSDRELVAAFVERRSELAFREMYRRHAPRLYLFILRLRGQARRDAEDVLQETWLRAARSLARFRFEAELRTWLTGIALNVCRERDRGRPARADDEIEETRVDERPAEVPERWARMDLEQALGALPAGYRRVLLLHDLEGYTHREIAKLLEIEEGTSKSQLTRARAALRRRLGETSSTNGTRGEKQT